MDDEVAVVDQGPPAILGTLEPQLGLAAFLHLLVDLDGDRVALPSRGGRDDHEVVHQRGSLPQVERQEDILLAVVVGNPAQNLVRSRARAIRFWCVPIGGVMRYIVLDQVRLAGAERPRAAGRYGFGGG